MRKSDLDSATMKQWSQMVRGSFYCGNVSFVHRLRASLSHTFIV